MRSGLLKDCRRISFVEKGLSESQNVNITQRAKNLDLKPDFGHCNELKKDGDMFNELINVEEMLESELLVTDVVDDDGPGFECIPPAESKHTEGHAINNTVKEHM